MFYTYALAAISFILIIALFYCRRDRNDWFHGFIEAEKKYHLLEARHYSRDLRSNTTIVQVLFTDLEEIEVIVVKNSETSIGHYSAEYLGVEPESGFIGYALDMDTARKHGDTFRYRKIYRLKDGRVVTANDLTPHTLLS